MADVINLRQARKRKARAEQAEVANANRVKFGRTLAERQVAAKEQSRETARLDGKKLARDSEDKE